MLQCTVEILQNDVRYRGMEPAKGEGEKGRAFDALFLNVSHRHHHHHLFGRGSCEIKIIQTRCLKEKKLYGFWYVLR